MAWLVLCLVQSAKPLTLFITLNFSPLSGAVEGCRVEARELPSTSAAGTNKTSSLQQKKERRTGCCQVCLLFVDLYIFN